MIDEGYTKFVVDWTRTPPLKHAAVADLIRWRKPLYESGLIGQYEDIGIGFGNQVAGYVIGICRHTGVR